MKNFIQLQNEKEILIQRDENGVPHVHAETEADLYYGQGYMQALDRGMEMLVTRIVGMGRASEILESSDEMLELDLFFRRMNWRGDATSVLSALDPSVAILGEAWCAGINARLGEETPGELRMRGYHPDPWRLEDTILLIRMAGYLGTQQTQLEAEQFIIEMIRAGIEPEKLEEIFPGMLEGLNTEILKNIRTDPWRPTLESSIRRLLPSMRSSNNWVVSGKRTESGKAMMACDPHMEAGRLPNILQEFSLVLGDRYMMGATIPGIPGLLMGRNNDVAWSSTYAFMDAVDTWVEDCREGKYRRGTKLKTQWARFVERREAIKRRKKEDVVVSFYENEHGILDGDPYKPGYYLATRWASGSGTGAKTIEQLFRMLSVGDVKEGMETVGQMETAWNWTLADAQGNIGYQMSGLLPRRTGEWSGLVPLPGWEMRNDWKGFVNHRFLPRKYNPREGFIVTANNDLNEFGKSRPINISMGSYRYDRITDLLTIQKKIGFDEMVAIQYDVHSVQAEKFLRILFPLLPDGEAAKVLSEWDMCYTVRSAGAALFERFYQALLEEVFGSGGAGRELIRRVMEESSIFMVFFESFDRVMLSERSQWFGGRSRTEVFRSAMERALQGSAKSAIRPGRLTLKHLISAGKISSLFRLDRGPYLLPGGRSTPNLTQIYRSSNRESSFHAVYRMILDFEENGIHTNLAGGPSERPLSRYYTSDLNNWLNAKYKKIGF